MSPGEREFGRRVIETRHLPSPGGVTDRAIGGKSADLVVRVGGSVVVLNMAGSAVGRRAGILPAHVTLGAANVHVQARQGELRVLSVIELRTRPVDRRVTQRAVGRNVGRLVIRIGSPVVVGSVAGSAVGRRTGKLSINVTLSARRLGVHAGQRELGQRVIKLRAHPT